MRATKRINLKVTEKQSKADEVKNEESGEVSHLKFETCESLSFDEGNIENEVRGGPGGENLGESGGGEGDETREVKVRRHPELPTPQEIASRFENVENKEENLEDSRGINVGNVKSLIAKIEIDIEERPERDCKKSNCFRKVEGKRESEKSSSLCSACFLCVAFSCDMSI